MKKERWDEQVGKAVEKLEETAGPSDNPEDWPETKKAIEQFVKDVDDVTRVYNEEKGECND